MGESMSSRAYVESGRAQDVLSRLPEGSVRLTSFSPPYLDVVDYERSAESGDNRLAWGNLAHAERARAAAQDLDPAKVERSGPGTNGSGTNGGATTGGKTNGNGCGETIDAMVAEYVEDHLRTCRQIERVSATESVVCVEVDDYRIDGEYRLVGLVDLWARMLEAVGFRIAERITLGRKIAVSRRGAHLMREEGWFRRAGYYAPANVTSTLLVGMKGEAQKRLRSDGRKKEAFGKDWAQKHIKTLWMLDAPGRERMDRSGHPCPQSLRVARAAVRFYSVEDDLVCDPYAGVGTTGRAALEEGRRVAMVEKMPEWCEEIRTMVETITGEMPQRMGESGQVVIPGAQLRLPLVGQDTQGKIQRAAYPEGGEPTKRHQEMADEIAAMIGMDVPPSLVSTFLRAERSVVRKRREKSTT